MRALLALGLFAVLGAGCASFGTHLAPRPTPPGELEVDGTVDAQLSTTGSGDLDGLPILELGVRYGVASGLDVGAKLGPAHVEVDSRIALVGGRDGGDGRGATPGPGAGQPAYRRPEPRGFELAVAPGIGFVAATSAPGHQDAVIFAAALPVLAGIPLGEDLRLVAGARATLHVGRTTRDVSQPDGSTKTELGGGEVVLYPGLLAGLEIRLIEDLVLLPELSLHVPYLFSTGAVARPVWQGGLSFQFHFPS